MSGVGKGITNARITSTMLGDEDHGIFTCFLYLDFDGGGVGFGGYGLDEWVPERSKRVDISGAGLEYIKEILRVVGVSKWEDLKDKYVRVDSEGWGGKALGIGNLLKDDWFYPKDWFETQATDSLNSDQVQANTEASRELANSDNEKMHPIKEATIRHQLGQEQNNGK